jgi:hypothetical protein
MKDKYIKYILFLFAKHKEQEKFVTILGEEIVTLTDSTDVQYYFGSESAIITFNSLESLDSIKDFFQIMLGASEIVYFLSPYEPDKMSYWLDRSVEKHLFNPDKTGIIVENTKEEQVEVQKLFIRELENGLDSLLKEIINEDDIKQIKSKDKPKVKTLDQLLDKIIDEGYPSLCDSEIKLLNEYSKK